MADTLMTKIADARDILEQLGLPPAQRNDISCLTLLALAGLGENTPWRNAGKPSLTIHQIYVGDAARKMLYLDESTIGRLHIPLTEHDKLPDVVLYDEKRDWLFLLEAVTSHGPMSPKRVTELQATLKNCTAQCVYVSAFPDFREFRRHVGNIAWETEVWIAEAPDHLIHFDGEAFLNASGTQP